MGALTDQRKRSCADLRLPVNLSSPKKTRYNPPSPSLNSPDPLQFSSFRRLLHGPQRIIHAFGLGLSPINKFSSLILQKKQDEELGLEEYKKLVEEQFTFPGEEVVRTNSIRQKSLSPELSTRNEAEVVDGSVVISSEEEDGKNETPGLVQVSERKFFVKSEPLYKELYEKTKQRDARINELQFETKLQQLKFSRFRIDAEVLKKREEKSEEYEVLFRPLTSEEDAKISSSLFGGNSRKVLVSHESSNIEITREILQCLRPGAWLNDEVINLYLELLKEREKREPKKFLKCHFFSTFFYKKLISEKHGYDFKAVRRWTTQRKLGYALIDCDKIFVPIHKINHWCLVVINMKDKSFQYLDSLGGVDDNVLKMLARYMKDEVKDKNSKEIDTLSWKTESVVELPLQKNGWDCGMFMLKYVDFYSRGLKLCFSQEHMTYFRTRTALDILRLKAE